MQPLLVRISWVYWLVGAVMVWGVSFGFVLSDSRAIAQEPPEELDVPWECSGYSGEAQRRCVRTLFELQQEKITRLEEQLKAQEGTVSELKEKLDRQESLARLEAQAYKNSSRFPLLPYAYDYPFGLASPYGFGLYPPSMGLYLGAPWRSPRYFGYGPGYWRQPGLSFHFRSRGGYRHRHW
jgi:hypothetical protein